MLREIGWLVVTLGTIALLTAGGPKLSPPSPTPLVEDPRARTIAADIGLEGVTHPYLLSYQSEVDDRPLYLESGLMAVQFENGTWQLVHVYRHRKEDNRWQISVVYDAPFVGSRSFEHRPSHTEVDQFLKETWWSFKGEEGFRMLESHVYTETWQAALGYVPKYR